MTAGATAEAVIADAITFKILVVGGFGIGKTTLIQEISDVPVVGTEVATSGSEAEVKPTTTVGVEYGLFSVGDDDAAVTLLLFGTPGQDRFAVARDVASHGADGMIVIVDGNDPSTWETGWDLHQTYNPDRAMPTLLVVNRWPADAAPPDGLTAVVPLAGGPAGISSGDVVDEADARRFIVDLLTIILHDEYNDEDDPLDPADG